MSILVYDEIWVREPRLMVPSMAPVGRVRINKDNQIGKYIVALVIPSVWRPVDIVSGRALSVTAGSPIIKADALGLVACTPGADDKFEDAYYSPRITEGSVIWFGYSVGSGNGPGGMLVVTHSNDSGTYPYVAIGIKRSTVLFFQFNVGGTYQKVETAQDISLGVPSVLVGSFQSGSQKLFLNGTEIGSSAHTGVIAYGTGSRLAVGEEYGAGRYGATNAYYGAVCSVPLTLADAKELYKDPWQIVVPA